MIKELNRLYKLGGLDECAKLLNRYYPIIKDHNWEDNKGFKRVKHYNTGNGKVWHVEQRNGEVVALGFESMQHYTLNNQ